MGVDSAGPRTWATGARAVLVTTVLALALGACSGSQDGTAVEDASVGGGTGVPSVHVPQDQSRWTLPTDPYVTVSAVVTQAFDEVQASCMRERGHESFRVRHDASAPAPETQAADGHSVVFNETVAATYGYRLAPDPRDLLADEIAAAGGSLYGSESDEFRTDLRECATEADTALNGGTPPPTSVPEESAESTAYSELDRLEVDFSSPQLSTAAESWRTCMAPLGIADLPERPWPPGNRPPESLVSSWGWELTGAPTADEIRVATADAACRRSSGWFDQLYEAEWNLRQEFVTQHAADLEPIRLQLEQQRAAAEQIIARGGA